MALNEWANNRSSQSFSERGQDAGELAPILEGGAGFFKSGRAAKSNEIAKDLSSTVKNFEKITAEEIAERAADLGIDLEKIEKVQERMPLNWDYAGRNTGIPLGENTVLIADSIDEFLNSFYTVEEG